MQAEKKSPNVDIVQEPKKETTRIASILNFLESVIRGELGVGEEGGGIGVDEEDGELEVDEECEGLGVDEEGEGLGVDEEDGELEVDEECEGLGVDEEGEGLGVDEEGKTRKEGMKLEEQVQVKLKEDKEVKVERNKAMKEEEWNKEVKVVEEEEEEEDEEEVVEKEKRDKEAKVKKKNKEMEVEKEKRDKEVKVEEEKRDKEVKVGRVKKMKVGIDKKVKVERDEKVLLARASAHLRNHDGLETGAESQRQILWEIGNHNPWNVEASLRERSTLATCDFLFPTMKFKLKGHRFGIVKEIQRESQKVLDRLQERDFQEAFQKWQTRWDQCIAAQMDYLEGDGSQI
ncbi:hypothetical protein ANN_13094 [Periplaneta americana]|uniref:Uncharacterized protein n=1 Tax=Periplaneta americana TaxID=6978 RepID=A0ABQ8TIF6_PERAM|nr:hypothetical protein ANN_13094 [Periplaneta americana]